MSEQFAPCHTTGEYDMLKAAFLESNYLFIYEFHEFIRVASQFTFEVCLFKCKA